MQATRIDMPLQLLEMVQANALDIALLDDVKAALIELDSRLHHRTSVLGEAASNLHNGYNALLENIQRVQQAHDAHHHMLQALNQHNQDLRGELEATREQLAEVRQQATEAKMGPQQWQAQIEAQMVKIQNWLQNTSAMHSDLQSRVTKLDETSDVNERKLSELAQKWEQSEQGSSGTSEVRAQVEHLCDSVRDQKQHLDEISRDVKDLSTSMAHLETHHAILQDEIQDLHQMCEHFAVYTDEDPFVDGPGMADYEAEWWNDGAQGWVGPPPGFTQTSPEAPQPAQPSAEQQTSAPDAQQSTQTSPEQPTPATHFGPPPGQPTPATVFGPSPEEPTSSQSGAKPQPDIHHGRWKLLQEVPALKLGAGEPWEQGMKLRTWFKQVETIAGTIADSFGAYVKRQFRWADDRHKQRLAGLHQLGPPPQTPQEDLENENRLVLLLIRCVPAELKQNVLEKGDESEPMRAIALLEGILETLQPGGAAEMQSLQSFVRNL